MRPSLALGACILALAVARDAAADCPAPLEYAADVQGSTVTLRPWSPDPQTSCPTAGAMLRQDVSRGSVVTLPLYCDDAGSYIDECVPPGTYNYGLAVPFACTEAACGAYYYSTVTLDAGVSGCQRSSGDPGPTDGGKVPWDGGAEIAYCGPPEDAGAPDAGMTGHPESSAGCSLTQVRGGVVAGDATALLLGGALLCLRRKRSG